jgi:hypothetical protein
MSNQLVSGGTITQGTTLGTEFVNQLVTGGSFQPTANACILDLTSPSFAGIDFLSRGPLGQLKAIWLAASDATLPLRYEVYVKPVDDVNLFNLSNIALVTSQLNADIFSLGNGTLLQTGVRYYVGVRAVDAVGNRDVNTVILNQVSPGITGATNAQISGVFAVNTSNSLIATFWVNDNDGVINDPTRLGTASYVIYDSAGNLVPGMSESGIAFDSNGFFEITPRPSVLDLNNTFYTVKVSIPVDGVQIIYNLPITYPELGPQYEPRAVFSINAANELQGTIWIVKDNQKLISNLGTASYAIRNKSGALVGISQSGITQTNGYYQITSVPANLIVDFNHYTVDISIQADGVVRTGAVGLVVGSTGI